MPNSGGVRTSRPKEKRGKRYMRRVFMLLTAAMAAMIAIGAGTAFAQTTTTGPNCTFAAGKTTCVTTTTTKETTTETTNLPNEFVVTNLPSEFVRTPTGGPCTVGNSGRVGTAEGISTQELAVTSTQALAVTSTQVFEVTSTQEFEVTSTQEFEVTTVTVKTEIFRGNSTNPRNLESSVTSPPVVTKTPTGDPVVDKTPTGDPVIDKTPTGDPVIDKTPVGDPVFTATGKCKNVSGPQPQARG